MPIKTDLEKFTLLSKARASLLSGLHQGQLPVWRDPARFKILVAGRKWRKTSLMIAKLFDGALQNNLVYSYIAPYRRQAKDVVWNDHVLRHLNDFKTQGVPYVVNESDLSVVFPWTGGKVNLFGVDNSEALRGISNWGFVCLVAGTMVETERGSVPIEVIRPGELVRTPTGLKKVTRAGETKKVTELIELQLDTGESLTCTPEHEIFTDNGLVRADELAYNDGIWTTKHHPSFPSTVQTTGYKAAVEKGIIAVASGGRLATSTERYGGTHTATSLTGGLSTTKTGTKTTTLSPTSSVLLQPNTRALTPATALGRTQKRSIVEFVKASLTFLHGLGQKRVELPHEKALRTLDPTRINGMGRKKDDSGTLSAPKKTGKTGNKPTNLVTSVREPTLLHDQTAQSIAPRVVRIERQSCVDSVPVYDLTVDTDHCFYANGILVSNCADEYADWRENIWPTIIRPNLTTNRAGAIIGGTPKGLNLLFDLYSLDDKNYKPFHFTSYDNPELSRDELSDMEREFRQFGETYFKQEMLASFERPVGAVYDEWEPATNYRPFDYDPSLPLHVAFDWGVHDPTAILWLQPGAGEVRIVDCYEGTDGSVQTILQLLRSKPYKTPDLYVGDPAGKQRNVVTATSIIDELAQNGIYVRTKTGVSIVDQVRVAHRYIKSTYVNSRKCERVRDCLLNYRYPNKDERRVVMSNSNENPIHDQYSHIMRAYEYWASSAVDIPSSMMDGNFDYDETPGYPIDFTGYVPIV